MVDKKFARKLHFLWVNEKDKTSDVIEKMFTDIIDPFYAAYQVELRKMDDNSSESQSLLDDINTKLRTQRKDLYNMYHDQLSPSKIMSSSTTAIMYLLKFIRLFVILGALYLASKTFQAKYVSKVFVDNDNPPPLYGFILIYLIIETIFMAFIILIVYLLKNVLSINNVFPITDVVFKNFLIDYGISTAIIAVLGLLLSHIVMKKKYFRYRTDGLRAIRSLQDMMFYISSVVLIFPYYILNPTV